MHFKCDLSALGEQFGIDAQLHFKKELAELQSMVDDKLVRVQDGQIETTDLGRGFIRNVAMLFDESLGDANSEDSRKYSQTL